MKDLLNRFKSFGIGILVFILYFMILPVFLSNFLSKYFKSSNAIISNVSLIFAELVILFVLMFIFRKKIIDNFKDFKVNYKKYLDTGFKYYFLGLLVMIISNLIISYLSGGLATNESVNREYLIKFPFYSVVAMVFAGPPIEEMVFRLGFRDAFKKCLPFCLFSALFFGGVHVYTAFDGMSMKEVLDNWIQFLYLIPYGSLGFAFAKAYFETDNIFTTMLIHILHNGFVIALIFLV